MTTTRGDEPSGHWTPGRPHLSAPPQPKPVVPQAPGPEPVLLPPPATAEPVDIGIHGFSQRAGSSGDIPGPEAHPERSGSACRGRPGRSSRSPSWRGRFRRRPARRCYGTRRVVHPTLPGVPPRSHRRPRHRTTARIPATPAPASWRPPASGHSPITGLGRTVTPTPRTG